MALVECIDHSCYTLESKANFLLKVPLGRLPTGVAEEDFGESRKHQESLESPPKDIGRDVRPYTRVY